MPGLVGAAPAALRVDAPAEGVHHRVQVRAHLEPVQPQVVGRVRDDGHPSRGRSGHLPTAQVVQETLQEPGAAHTAGQDGDLERVRVVCHAAVSNRRGGLRSTPGVSGPISDAGLT